MVVTGRHSQGAWVNVARAVRSVTEEDEYGHPPFWVTVLWIILVFTAAAAFVGLMLTH